MRSPAAGYITISPDLKMRVGHGCIGNYTFRQGRFYREVHGGPYSFFSYFQKNRRISTAYESLTLLISTFLDISCFVIKCVSVCVLHSDMCPFCHNFRCSIAAMVAMAWVPPPPCPLDQPLPLVILSRSGRLVRHAEHGYCSFRFKIRASSYLSIIK